MNLSNAQAHRGHVSMYASDQYTQDSLVHSAARPLTCIKPQDMSRHLRVRVVIP